MNILLISVNRERMPAPVFPLGLACLARGLEEEGHRLEVIDLCFSQDIKADLKETLLCFQPDLTGISLRNLDNLTYPTSHSYLKEVEEVVSICRRLSSSKLVIGGSGFSLASGELLAHLNVDFGIVGEGEAILLGLVNSLENKLPLSPSPHLLIKDHSSPHITKGARVFPLSAPDRTLFHTRRYLEEGGMLNLQTKRGCPFSCIYCTYPLLEGERVRLREVEEVVQEIRQLIQEQETDYIYFVDDIFNYPPSFAEKLCRRMAEEKLQIRWSAFVNPGFLKEDLLKWMKEAGCAGVEFGTDSGSPRMLKNYGKSFTVEEIAQASQLCSKLNVNHCHYLLFGGPGEDEETIEESFRLMDQLNPTAVIAMLGIRIYPGTGLERISLSEGIIEKNTNLIYPHFYISPALNGRLEDLIREKALGRKQWIVPGLEINITQNLMEQIRRFKVRGPLWELVGRMKKPRVKPLKSELK
ncbi:MAG: B12-binding domain-containing radical SAM protein [Deltaproteobacteria bacterium RBG_16_49_23]|nr:MAG: B12-binding domain-containing radical SAM protein [Deltaproteobacteria bacterium RBG_16_49_23]